MHVRLRPLIALLVIAPMVYLSAVGVAYEPINYDGRSYRPLLGAPDPLACTTFAAPAGDDLVTVDGVSLAGWYRPGQLGPDRCERRIRRPIEAITQLGNRPVLIVAAGSDDTIAVDEIRGMHDRATTAGVEARLEVCANAEHHQVVNTCPEDYARWVNELLDRINVGGAP